MKATPCCQPCHIWPCFWSPSSPPGWLTTRSRPGLIGPWCGSSSTAWASTSLPCSSRPPAIVVVTLSSSLSFFLAVGVNGAQYAGFMCVHLDMASNFAGTLLGITNCAANMMGVVAPAVAGYLTQDHSDAPHWRVVFFVAALVYIVGNTIFLVWGSAKEQSWNRESGAAGGLGVEEDNEDDPMQDLMTDCIPFK